MYYKKNSILSILSGRNMYQFFNFWSIFGFDVQDTVPRACQVLSVGQKEQGVKRIEKDKYERDT